MSEEIQIEQIPYYLTWRLRHEVMYPELTTEDVKLENDKDGLHFGLYLGRQLISILSLFEQGEVIQLRKFATLQEFQRRGFGRQLLKYAIAFSIKSGAKQIWCNARENAAKMYLSFGFIKTEERYSANGYDFVRMELRIK